MDNVTINLRNLYTKAYLGVTSTTIPRFWICFGVSVPPLGWSTYFISQGNGKGIKRSNSVVMDIQQNQTVDIGPENLKMSFSPSGQLLNMFNAETKSLLYSFP